jgi:hypothetical protein
MPRDYAKEYREYHGRPDQIKKRAQRVMARREMERDGKVRKGDGMDVDHIRPIRSGGGNDKSNLRVVPRGRNRGWRDGV